MIRTMVDNDIVVICASGNKDGVGEVIESNENESVLTKQVLYGKTPIEIATCFGHLDVVEELVKNGISIDHTSQSGYSLLHWAACWGRLDLIKYFVDAHVNIFTKNEHGETAKGIALRYHQDECVSYLKKAELLQTFKQQIIAYKEIIADPEKNLGRFTKEEKVHGNRFCDEKMDWLENNRDLASYQQVSDKKNELEQQLKNTMKKLETP